MSYRRLLDAEATPCVYWVRLFCNIQRHHICVPLTWISTGKLDIKICSGKWDFAFFYKGNIWQNLLNVNLNFFLWISERFWLHFKIEHIFKFWWFLQAWISDLWSVKHIWSNYRNFWRRELLGKEKSNKFRALWFSFVPKAVVHVHSIAKPYLGSMMEHFVKRVNIF